MRILIATVTAGGGHLAAAAALDEAWRSWRPKDTVERVDLVKFFSPLHRKIHADGYVKLVERAPELWGMLFAKTDNPKTVRRLNRIQQLFPSRARLGFARFVKKFQPDAVLSTHFTPVTEMGEMRRKNPQPSPLSVSIVTDFEAHALWMDPHVDLYCVAAEETKARLVARGAAEADVLATGIPIAAKFAGPLEGSDIRKRMGWREDLPVMLVLGGGFGMGPVAEIVRELDKVKREFQIVVVCGRNQDLRRELAVQDRKHPTHVLGFANNMHELMGVADLILTKPGGLTTSEALALGKPLFILDPIPGQEAANSDFLLERGAAAKVNRVVDLPFRIEKLLGSKKLTDMAKAAQALGKPHSAETVCQAVWDRLTNRSPTKPR